jgi:CheY-like chemotaxis protein
MSFPLSPDSAAGNRRVIVIDDNAAIHDDVRKILCPPPHETTDALESLERELMGAEATPPKLRVNLKFHVDSAHQGREGLRKVEEAVGKGLPYAVALVDIRMPPGWDGIETTIALWRAQPDLQIVVCTAYSDYSWDDMIDRLGLTDSLFVLRKPFDSIELLQLAHSLTEKWTRSHALQRRLAELEQQVRPASGNTVAFTAA